MSGKLRLYVNTLFGLNSGAGTGTGGDLWKVVGTIMCAEVSASAGLYVGLASGVGTCADTCVFECGRIQSNWFLPLCQTHR